MAKNESIQFEGILHPAAHKTGSFAKRVASKVCICSSWSTMIVNEGGGGKRKTIQKKKKISQKIRLK